MSTITLRIPDTKHERLKQYAKDQGLIFDEFATVALAQSLMLKYALSLWQVKGQKKRD